MKDLHEAAKKAFRFNNYGLANYGWLLKDGSVSHCDVHICHAGLRCQAPATSVAVVSQIKFNPSGYLSEDIAREFYQWLLNDSPLAKVFLTKDVDLVFKDKFVLLDVEQPVNVIIASAILHRHIWEEIKVPRAWHDLVAAGIDPNGAFILSHLIGIGYGPYDKLGERNIFITLNSKNINHTIFDGHINGGTLTNFRNSKLINAGKQPSTKGYSYGYEVGALFQFQNYSHSLLSSVINLLGVKREEGKIKNNNPFTNTPGVIKKPPMNYAKLIETLAEIYPQICEEDEKCSK